MLPILPTEILSEIIQQASYRTASPTLTSQHNYHPTVLANLSLVSRTFYNLSAALLYRDIIVFIDLNTSHLIPILLPLLTLPQRAQLASEATPDEDLNIAPLQHKNRIVDPSWVHRLVILESRPSRPGEENIPWRYLEEAVSGMSNLRSITWEASGGSPRFLKTLVALPNLQHVSCARNSLLCSPDAAADLKRIRLRSLTMYHQGHTEPMYVGGARNLICPSADSLKALHLAFRDLSAAGVTAQVTGMLEGVESLPELRSLTLGGYELSTIETFAKLADFSKLETLQLVRKDLCPGTTGALLGAGLPALKKLSVTLLLSEAVEILSACTGLREVHIATMDGEDTPRVVTETMIGALAKHGRTLRAFSLKNLFLAVPPKPTVLGARDVKRIVEACPGVQDLYLNINLEDFTTIATTLPGLRQLRHLSLHIDGPDTDTVVILPGTETLIPTTEPWYDPTDEPEDGQRGPKQLTEHEHVLWHILAAADYKELVEVTLSSTGIYPFDAPESFPQSYLVRGVESEPVNVESVFWRLPMVAPAGHRYEFRKGGRRVCVEVVRSVPLSTEAWRGRVAAWSTAFVPASLDTQWERVLM